MSSQIVKGNTANIARANRRPQSVRSASRAVTIIGLLALGLTLQGRIGSTDKVVVTFSGPVELPGKALPAGTYVFKVLDNLGDRDIVQVLDKDEKQLLGTYVAIPDYRDTPPSKPIVNFEERRSDAPPAVKAIYFPGETYGLEFVYPHDRALQLAKRTGQNVLSMGDENTQNITAPASSTNTPSVQQLEKTDVTGVDPSGAPVEVVIIVGSKPER